MKIQISPRFEFVGPLVRALESPDFFDRNGEILHDGRNTLKRFRFDNQDLAVKRYGRLSLLNRLIYGVLRPSKAVRVYRHAIRLRRLGIDTPREVASIDIRHHGLLSQSGFILVCSEFKLLQPVTELDTQRSEVRAILDALTAFQFRLHRAGILHRDPNIGNILYISDGPGAYRFQVIVTNRMVFCRRLSVRQRLDNLRCLSCQVPAYLYILDQYARLFRTDTTTVQLRGAVMRLAFEMRHGRIATETT